MFSILPKSKNKFHQKLTMPIFLLASLGVSTIVQAAGDGAIGGSVWNDLNGDGVQNSNEPHIAGVNISLLDGPIVIGETTTIADGTYQFDNLNLQRHFVRFELPHGCKFTQRNIGNNDNIDSDARSRDGRSPRVTLRRKNPSNFSIDAGLLCAQPETQPEIQTVANDDSITVTAHALLPFPRPNLLANDTLSEDDTSILSVISGTVPAGIRVIESGVFIGDVRGTPTAVGTFTFDYQVISANGESNTATVTMVIQPIPADKITIANDDFIPDTGARSNTLNLLANDEMFSGGFSSIEVISGTYPGALVLGGTYSGPGALRIRRTRLPEDITTFSFVYRLTTLDGTSDTATVTVEVK